MTALPAIAKRVRSWTFGRLVAWRLKGVPRRLRYRAALDLAESLCPLRRVLPLTVNPFEDPMPGALRLVLISATDQGIEFDPEIDAPDPSPLRWIAARGTGAVACTAHLALSPLFLRYLHDHDLKVAGLSARKGWRICGTTVPLPSYRASPQVFLQARRHLREGAVFAAMIDSGSDTDAVLIPATTPRRFIRMPIFRFAAAVRVPVISFATTLGRDGRAVIRFTVTESEDPDLLGASCATLLSDGFAAASAWRTH